MLFQCALSVNGNINIFSHNFEIKQDIKYLSSTNWKITYGIL